MDKHGVVHGKPSRDGLCWGAVDEGNRCQWYFDGEPCTLLAWGFRNGEKAGAPIAQKVRTKTGKIKVIWCKEGSYPGLTYEVFQHEAGNA